MRRPRLLGRLAVIALAATALAGVAVAQEVNCANEFRSGKLDFQEFQKSKQANRTEEAKKLLERTLDNFELAAATCPEKAEYHWRYAIALAEAGNMAFEDAAFAVDEAAREEANAKAMEYYALAGQEFEVVKDSEEGTKGKHRKGVRENRGHYWVDHYNEAIELLEDEDYAGAANHFEVCRLLNPVDQRAYIQGAIALVRLGERDAALELVDTGRAQPGEDWTGETYKTGESEEQFVALEKNIYRSRAKINADLASENNDAALFEASMSDYSKLLEWSPEDPDLYFDRGFAGLSSGSVAADPTAAYAAAAGDFRKAGDLVKADAANFEANFAFYADAKFNELQAWVRAEDEAKILEVTREYICVQPTDASGWRNLAGSLISGGDQENAVAALIMSKSMQGDEVPLEAARKSATADASAALAELGDPDLVKTYQEQSSGNQITTMVWLDKKVARHFILGASNGEVTWCQ